MGIRHALAIAMSIAAAGCGTTTSIQSRAQPGYAAPSAPLATTVEITLNTDQAHAVRRFYAGIAGDTRGARGRRRLPPGIARNLARGKALPPGIAKNYLPASLVVSLPVPPSGLDYVIVAGKLLLVEAATQVVREILLDLAFD